MGLVNQIEIRPLCCIHPAEGIDICPVDLASTKEFRLPSSHETNLVYIAPKTVEDLFVHRFQTDQLVVIKGQVVLVILQNGRYQYLLLTDRDPRVVRIPPGIPHGSINLTADPCIAINSVLRHGPTHPRDYRPLKQPFPYNLEIAEALLDAAAKSYRDVPLKTSVA